MLCDCDDLTVCTQPECVADRAEEAARWHAIFAATPDAIAYTSDDLRSFRVHDGREWKYEDSI